VGRASRRKRQRRVRPSHAAPELIVRGPTGRSAAFRYPSSQPGLADGFVARHAGHRRCSRSWRPLDRSADRGSAGPPCLGARHCSCSRTSASIILLEIAMPIVSTRPNRWSSGLWKGRRTGTPRPGTTSTSGGTDGDHLRLPGHADLRQQPAVHAVVAGDAPAEDEADRQGEPDTRARGSRPGPSPASSAVARRAASDVPPASDGVAPEREAARRVLPQTGRGRRRDRVMKSSVDIRRVLVTIATETTTVVASVPAAPTAYEPASVQAERRPRHGAALWRKAMQGLDYVAR
jgi:hypothetical protein